MRFKLNYTGWFLVCVLSIFGMSVVTHANVREDTSEIVNNSSFQLDRIDLNEDDFKEENKKLIKEGEMLIYSKASKFLSVSNYYQDGESWSNDVMNTCGDTIDKSGCALTSFSMIARYYGSSFNPRGVNNKLGSNACPFAYNNAASTFGYTVSHFSSSTQSIDNATSFIVGSINSDKPVLVGMQKGNSTHFVTAYAYNGNTIYIQDPERDLDYDTLRNYYDQGWTVNRLVVFQK